MSVIDRLPSSVFIDIGKEHIRLAHERRQIELWMSDMGRTGQLVTAEQCPLYRAYAEAWDKLNKDVQLALATVSG